MSERASLCECVYLGFVIPAPDYPPRQVTVPKVFLDQEKALEWAAAQPPVSSNSTYRKIERREVER